MQFEIPIMRGWGHSFLCSQKYMKYNNTPLKKGEQAYRPGELIFFLTQMIDHNYFLFP